MSLPAPAVNGSVWRTVGTPLVQGVPGGLLGGPVAWVLGAEGHGLRQLTAKTCDHLVSIPITNTSVNPARSTGVALFADTAAMSQLWLFWLAPLAGALAAGLVARWLHDEAK